MKRAERDKALVLRSQGKSLNEIVKILNVSKASVSLWVRNVALTEAQRQQLTARGYSVDAIEKRRINRMSKTKERHDSIKKLAGRDIENISERDLWLIGIALYWGEGSKTSKGTLGIANSDPFVIEIMMRFFREIMQVPEEKFRCHVHTFSHLNARLAEKYWSNIAHVPLSRFYKTYSKPSIASKGKKDSLPFGTVQVYVSDTRLQLTMIGWIDRLKEFSK